MKKHRIRNIVAILLAAGNNTIWLVEPLKKLIPLPSLRSHDIDGSLSQYNKSHSIQITFSWTIWFEDNNTQDMQIRSLSGLILKSRLLAVFFFIVSPENKAELSLAEKGSITMV